MADVFEKAIEGALREEFGRENVHHQPGYKDRIRVIGGEPAIPVTFIPDNVIGPKEAPRLIVDAKYKKPLIGHYGDRFRNSDLYQAFTYAATLDALAGLVYPSVNRDVDVAFDLDGKAVQALAIDLRRTLPISWVRMLRTGGKEVVKCQL
jgi:5-methylcytosine-specific restriction endonuclease McrBC regulatory subunit McrC